MAQGEFQSKPLCVHGHYHHYLAIALEVCFCARVCVTSAHSHCHQLRNDSVGLFIFAANALRNCPTLIVSASLLNNIFSDEARAVLFSLDAVEWNPICAPCMRCARPWQLLFVQMYTLICEIYNCLCVEFVTVPIGRGMWNEKLIELKRGVLILQCVGRIKLTALNYTEQVQWITIYSNWM